MSTTTKPEGLLADEAPIWELDELRQLIAGGQERGYLTIEQVTACLEEVDVTKEQVRELHSHLEEQGIEHCAVKRVQFDESALALV